MTTPSGVVTQFEMFYYNLTFAKLNALFSAARSQLIHFLHLSVGGTSSQSCTILSSGTFGCPQTGRLGCISKSRPSLACSKCTLYIEPASVPVQTCGNRPFAAVPR